jgi:hypothetical protein
MAYSKALLAEYMNAVQCMINIIYQYNVLVVQEILQSGCKSQLA